MTVVVALIAVSRQARLACKVEARPTVAARKRILAHPHEAHDAKRNRAQRNELREGDTAPQESNGRRSFQEQPGELSAHRFEGDCALVSAEFRELVELHDCPSKHARGLAALVILREQGRGNSFEQLGPRLQAVRAPGLWLDLEEKLAEARKTSQELSIS